MTDVQLAKAGAHPLRVRIMQAIDDGLASSPNQLADLLDEPLGNVSYHVKTLLEFGCLVLEKTEPRRGAVEHFYRSSGAWSPGRELVLSEGQRRLAAKVIDLVIDPHNAAVLSPSDSEGLDDLYALLLEGLIEPVPA